MKLNLENFFDLYAAFLDLDSKIALVYGRNREIIRHFLLWYLDSNKGEKSYQDKILELFVTYRKQSTYSNHVKLTSEPKLSLSFLEKQEEQIKKSQKILQKSIQVYLKWRQSLTRENALILAKHNMQDRLEHYFSLEKAKTNDFVQFLEELLKNCCHGIVIPKQFLIEFHNGMSHLVQAYFTSKCREENISRACNHFKRGALDLYKIIIKDFFALHREQNTLSVSDLEKDLIGIRHQEYRFIGDDYAKMSNASFEESVGSPNPTLFDSYYQLCLQLLESNNSSPTPPSSSSHS